jgi:stage III sporulation protein AA
MIIANQKTTNTCVRQNVHPRLLDGSILDCLPGNIRYIIERIPIINLQHMEEIRLRVNRPLMLYDSNAGRHISADSKISHKKEGAYIVSRDDIHKTIELISDNSIYAVQEELRNGYITVRGGHRIGIAGTIIHNNGKISLIKDISGINIRISKQIIGAADRVMKHIINKNNGVYNALIISPPQCGKTTLLRDVCRQLSYGIKKYNFIGVKVGVVDERSEIAGCHKGVPQNDIGPETDVLDACPKAHGMIMMIRAMSPNVIITDEIGTHEDIVALRQVLNAGVKVITSIHGYGREDISNRIEMRELLDEGIFERIIVLSKSNGTGTIEEIYDLQGRLQC